jgi:hypothetical protein
MRYGFWLPVFGGWLRNIDDEQMPATWDYVRDLQHHRFGLTCSTQFARLE